METKSMVMILGVALLAATATVYTQSAGAACGASTPVVGGVGGVGCGANGVIGGQTAHGLATACSHSNVADHNPNCGSSRPTDQARSTFSSNGGRGGNGATGSTST